MRIASALSSRQLRKGPLLTIGTIVVGALGAYEAADYVIREDFTGMAYAGMALVGARLSYEFSTTGATGSTFS